MLATDEKKLRWMAPQARVLWTEAHVRAYSLMRLLFPPLVIVYWLGWLWLPEGRLRAGWTDAPTVLLWAALFVLALPQMIQMWTEPDDPGEPRIVAEKEA